MKKYSFSHMDRTELRHAVKRADPSIFEDLIQFLEDDLRTFGSGYAKEKIWKYIRRYDLQPDDISRLEKAALQYLYRPMSREFKHMCQTMCRIASNEFWKQVETHLLSDNKWSLINASCLHPYSISMKNGEKLRLAWRSGENRRQVHEYIRMPYRYENTLLSMVKDPKHWIDGIVLHCEANQVDLPIVYYNPKRDLDFTRLDVSKSEKHILLSSLKQFLSAGTLEVGTKTAWIYAIYLLYRVNDVRAVPIIIEFLETKIDYKFESLSKYLIQMSCLKILRHYKTTEALSALEKYKEADEVFAKNAEPDQQGWFVTYPAIES